MESTQTSIRPLLTRQKWRSWKTRVRRLSVLKLWLLWNPTYIRKVSTSQCRLREKKTIPLLPLERWMWCSMSEYWKVQSWLIAYMSIYVCYPPRQRTKMLSITNILRKATFSFYERSREPDAFLLMAIVQELGPDAYLQRLYLYSEYIFPAPAYNVIPSLNWTPV